jgi:hypothetical protein
MDDTDEEVAVMNVEVKRLYQLPRLPTTLIELNCGYNNLSRLPELPETLRILKCGSNCLSQLPKLPALTWLEIHSNDFKTLRRLPSSLNYLSCGSNEMLKLPKLPHYLKRLSCDNNQLTKLNLPPQLEELYCSQNQIQKLILPSSLKIVTCYGNQIKSLILPDTLEELNCGNNQLTSLSLPFTLKKLDCNKNNISSLNLNKNLVKINLSYNPFVSVPSLPIGLRSINFKFTKIESCFEITDAIIESGYLFLYDSPLYRKVKALVKTDEHITCPVGIKIAFQLINIIESRFKRTYYSMKAKARMLAWMWRARENIAMKKYHPDELFKRLDDLDALEQW